MRDTFENVLNKPSVFPILSAAGANNGVAVDTLGYGDGMCIVTVGAATGTPDSLTVAAKLQESVDSAFSSPVDITGAAIVTLTAGTKSAEIRLSLGKRAAHKRWVRAVVTPAFVNGTSPKIPIAATILLANPEVAPVANSTTGN